MQEIFQENLYKNRLIFEPFELSISHISDITILKEYDRIGANRSKGMKNKEILTGVNRCKCF